ncbi:MAG: ABC transporter substrate-binding protein [Betaproteobacteria bacterium]
MKAFLRMGFACWAAMAVLSHSPAIAAGLDSPKTLRTAFLIAETTFDPVIVSDLYSNTINEAIFDSLLTYDFLARPVKLVPNTAAALPEVSEQGRVYTFRLAPGIYFADDAAFAGNKRELTSHDYAYTLRRLLDPKNRSPWLWYVEGKIIGGDEAVAAAKKSGKFDYDQPIAGIETPDKYTLRLRLKETDYNFIYIFATVQTAAMAREVVEKYQPDAGAHPVGSGPFRVAEWKRSHKIVLEANPAFREVFYDADPGSDPAMQAVQARMKGRKLPLVQRVEVTIVEESQPRWLAFLNGETDYSNTPLEFVGSAFPGGKLAPNLLKQGMLGQRHVEPDLVYTFFNLDHPVVGGITPEKIALRRAIALAYNYHEDINVIRNGGAIKAESPVPPGVQGYDPAFKTPQVSYDPPRARALLDMYGYVDRDGDGFRESPDGKPLVIELASEPDSTSKQFQELWKKNLDAIGIRLAFNVAKWPDLNKQAKAGKLQMWQLSWGADYPDAENFLQNLYGPNTESGTNYAHFKNAQFDALYDRAKKMPSSPERTAIYNEMNKLVAVYTPWIPTTHRLRSEVSQPWLVGYFRHPIINAPWLYLDIDETKRPRK